MNYVLLTKLRKKTIMINQEKRFISDDWYIPDVQTLVAEKMDKTITDNDAWIVLQHVHRRLDANIGINLDVIKAAVNTLLAEGKITLQ